MWKPYRVRLDFLTKLYGSYPVKPDMITAWVESRMPSVKPGGAKPIHEIVDEAYEAVSRGEHEPSEEFSLHVFPTGAEGHLVARSATMRAHLKDCARTVSSLYLPKVKGERSLAVRITSGLYQDPARYWTPILRPDGQPVEKADGTVDKPVHTFSPRGMPINALKRIEYVEPARIDFHILVMENVVHERDLKLCLDYGAVHGYGGERSADGGKYTYTLEEVQG